MLKIIALLLMVIDHTGIFLFPEYAFVLRGIGQAGWPLFCFLIVQGAFYTSDRMQYLINIVFCASITQPIWQLVYPETNQLNDLFTLLFGLIIIFLYEKYDKRVFLLLLPLFVLNVITYYIAVVFIIYFNKDDFYNMFFWSAAFYLLSTILFGELYALGGLLYILFLIKPLPRLNLNKYIFYVFYPSHYLVFYFIR